MDAAAFREAMAALPEPPANSQPPYWQYWRHDLWWRAQHDARPMWDWPCLRHTMLTAHFPIGEQMAYLREDWPRWERAFCADDHEQHTRNLAHQAYHLRLFERTSGKRIDEIESIHEFGGGYGAFAHLCQRMGFRGKYYITDLKEFQILQQYFLSQNGVEVVHVDKPSKTELFVACFSLSETDDATRQRWGTEVDADNYLLLYSGQWAQYDNMKWAREFMTARKKTWAIYQYLNNRPDWYSIGY